MKTIIDVTKWKRYPIFLNFHNKSNPFAIITTEINITNIYNYCKKNNKSIYATFGYLITKVVNNIEEFRYRLENGKIVLYDKIKSNFTENINDETIGFFTIDYDDNFDDYINNFYQERDKLFKDYKITYDGYDEIWLSCQPWFSYTAAIPPFDHDIVIPQFIWDKFKINGCITTNLTILAHHGFVDGAHIGKFINDLQKEINNFKGE